MKRIISIFVSLVLAVACGVAYAQQEPIRSAQVGNIPSPPSEGQVGPADTAKAVEKLPQRLTGRWEFTNPAGNFYSGETRVALPSDATEKVGTYQGGEIYWQGNKCTTTKKDVVVERKEDGSLVLTTVLCTGSQVIITLARDPKNSRHLLEGSYTSSGTAAGTNIVYLNSAR